MSEVVSGCLMKGMAGYNHYEEIVSSLCPPLSCHCSTNMGDIIRRLLNEAINIYSEVECRYILLSAVVSGCPMKSMAGYDYYEFIVSSPCYSLNCHR